MNWCVRKSKLKAAQPMELPKNDDGKKPFLRRNEAAELLLAARREPRVRDYLPDFILFGIYHGARKGAELDVQWYPNDEAGHVDLRQYRIDFNGNRPVTKKCRPLAVVSNRLRCFLPHWRKKRRRYVIERNGEKLADIKRGFKSVCLEAAKVFERLAAAAERQGDYIAMHEHLESVARLKIATPHILRHTCITWLLQAGFSCWEVGKFVGDRAATIEKTYGHHCSKYQASLANAFSRNGVARPKPLLVVMEEAA
jgi:integrase